MQNNMLLFVYRFKNFYTSSFKPLCEKHDLSQMEVDVLLFLINNPEYNTARDICNMRGIAKSNVSAAMRRLERRGLIFRRDDRKNLKIHRIFLSDNHKELFQELSECQQSCFSVMLRGIEPEQMEQMKRFFELCDGNIKKEFSGKEEDVTDHAV